MAETFTNGVYEQSDSLKPAADKLKLEIQTASGVAPSGPWCMTGVLSNGRSCWPRCSRPTHCEKKRNTEAVETGPNQLVAARVTQYTPSAYKLPAR